MAKTIHSLNNQTKILENPGKEPKISTPCKLTLGELELGAGTFLSIFLALFHAWVSG